MSDTPGQMAPEEETPLYSFMPNGSAMNMVTVFKDCIEMRVDGRVIRKPIRGWCEAVMSFSETANERDMAKADAAAVRCLMNSYNLGGWTDALGPMERALVAEALADPYVCDFIRNESGELEDGWREIDIQPEGMEHELRYAAARHLIERHSEVMGRFRFTDAGKERL